MNFTHQQRLQIQKHFHFYQKSITLQLKKISQDILKNNTVPYINSKNIDTNGTGHIHCEIKLTKIKDNNNTNSSVC